MTMTVTATTSPTPTMTMTTPSTNMTMTTTTTATTATSAATSATAADRLMLPTRFTFPQHRHGYGLSETRVLAALLEGRRGVALPPLARAGVARPYSGAPPGVGSPGRPTAFRSMRRAKHKTTRVCSTHVRGACCVSACARARAPPPETRTHVRASGGGRRHGDSGHGSLGQLQRGRRPTEAAGFVPLRAESRNGDLWERVQRVGAEERLDRKRPRGWPLHLRWRLRRPKVFESWGCLRPRSRGELSGPVAQLGKGQMGSALMGSLQISVFGYSR